MIAPLSPLSTRRAVDDMHSPQAPSPGALEVREKFQDFVAGTFYRTMLKALRSGQKGPAYLHGGQAEEIFRSELDGEFSQAFAKTHGASFSDDLYHAYARDHRPEPGAYEVSARATGTVQPVLDLPA